MHVCGTRWSILFISLGEVLIHVFALDDKDSGDTCPTAEGPSVGLALMAHKRTIYSKIVATRRKCVNMYADGLDKVRKNLGHSIRNHPMKVAAASHRHIVIGAGSGTTATHSLQRALQLLGMHTSHYMDKPKYAEWATKLVNILGGQDAPNTPMSASAAAKCRQELRQFNYTSLPSTVDAVLDTPVAELFINILLSFPNAQVILTTRPAADWVRSRRKHDKSDGFVPFQEPCGLYIGYGATVFNDAELETLFDLNNELVRCLVPKKQLFEINVWTEPRKRMDSMMTELAGFLGIYDFDGEDLSFPNK
jgi:hypothetical protein